MNSRNLENKIEIEGVTTTSKSETRFIENERFKN